MKKIAFLLFASLLLFACKEKPTVDDIKEFEVTNTVLNLRLSSEGDQILYTPKEAYGKITWTSADEKVAAVDSKSGYVTPTGKGSTTITGTLANGFKAEVSVSVMTDQDYYTNPENFDLYDVIPLVGSYNTYYYPFSYYDEEKKERVPYTYGYITGDMNSPNASDLIDSCMSLKYYILNKETYMSGDGLAGEGGPMLLINTSALCWRPKNGGIGTMWSLGPVQICDLDTVIPRMPKYLNPATSDSAEFPFIPPMMSPVTKFDKDKYTEFTTLALFPQEGAPQPNRDAYAYNGHSYKGRKDALGDEVLYAWPVEDGLGPWTWGTLDGGFIYINNHPTDPQANIVTGYHIYGKFFGGSHLTGFKTEYKTPDDGPEYEKPGNYFVVEGEGEDAHYVLEDMVKFEFSKEVPQEAPQQVRKGVPMNVFMKQTMVNQALYLPLIQKVESRPTNTNMAFR